MLEPGRIARRRRDALQIFEAALAAVLPARFLPPALPAPPPQGRLVVLAAGKAAGSMAAAAEAHYLDHLNFPASRLEGMAITRHGYAVPTRRLRMFETGHPIPDQAGIEATEALIDFARGCGAQDRVVFLLSGGASSNLVAPAGAITLAEKQAITKALLRKGVPISGINTVRKHLSRVKGGRLAALLAPAPTLTLAISDIPGDDLSAIGSGPTLPDPSSMQDARNVIERFGIDLPASAAAVLADSSQETPKPGDAMFAACEARIIARPADAFAAACAAAANLGYAVRNLGADLEGEARAIAQQHAEAARAARQSGEKIALISGGELTVTLTGNGRGGPNQEYALALAIALAGAEGITALVADTDGTDGGVGAPSDPAGAFVDQTSLARAKKVGIDAQACLANNDSTRFFAGINDLYAPGPTLTNANDLRILLVHP